MAPGVGENHEVYPEVGAFDAFVGGAANGRLFRGAESGLRQLQGRVPAAWTGTPKQPNLFGYGGLPTKQCLELGDREREILGSLSPFFIYSIAQPMLKQCCPHFRERLPGSAPI